MRVKVWESQSSGSTLFILAVWRRVASVAQVRPPSWLPANRLFFLVIVWGLIARSTMLESISIRPSVRKCSSASRGERVADCFGGLGLARDLAQLLLPKIEEAGDVGYRFFPTQHGALSASRPRTSSSMRHSSVIAMIVSVAAIETR